MLSFYRYSGSSIQEFRGCLSIRGLSYIVKREHVRSCSLVAERSGANECERLSERRDRAFSDMFEANWSFMIFAFFDWVRAVRRGGHSAFGELHRGVWQPDQAAPSGEH